VTGEQNNQGFIGFSKTHKPFTAFIAGVRFLADIEETRHFFTLTDAVDGPRNEANYQRFMKTDTGVKLDAEGVNFADVLSNRSMLEAQPANSLAHDYLNFLDTEKLNLEMLLGAETIGSGALDELDVSRRNYTISGIALHDLLHVVTEYGRDPLGEACLLAFTAEQFSFMGVGLFAHALALREHLSDRNCPGLAAAAEARERARASRWTPEIDWRDYLSQPTSVVRAEIGLPAPEIYLNYRRRLSEAGSAIVEADVTQKAA